MRYYIEEQVDWKWDGIKQYILDIKDFTVEALIDESLKNMRDLNPDATYLKLDWWIKDYKEYQSKKSVESLIATAVEEKFYVFDDEEEHEWNKHVVHSVINGEGWVHRWDNVEYK